MDESYADPWPNKERVVVADPGIQSVACSHSCDGVRRCLLFHLLPPKDEDGTEIIWSLPELHDMI